MKMGIIEERDGLGSCIEAECERKVNQNGLEVPPLVTETLIDKQSSTYRALSCFPCVCVVSCPVFTLISFSSKCQIWRHPGHTDL